MLAGKTATWGAIVNDKMINPKISPIFPSL